MGRRWNKRSNHKSDKRGGRPDRNESAQSNHNGTTPTVSDAELLNANLRVIQTQKQTLFNILRQHIKLHQFNQACRMHYNSLLELLEHTKPGCVPQALRRYPAFEYNGAVQFHYTTGDKMVIKITDLTSSVGLQLRPLRHNEVLAHYLSSITEIVDETTRETATLMETGIFKQIYASLQAGASNCRSPDDNTPFRYDGPIQTLPANTFNLEEVTMAEHMLKQLSTPPIPITADLDAKYLTSRDLPSLNVFIDKLMQQFNIMMQGHSNRDLNLDQRHLGKSCISIYLNQMDAALQRGDIDKIIQSTYDACYILIKYLHRSSGCNHRRVLMLMTDHNDEVDAVIITSILRSARIDLKLAAVKSERLILGRNDIGLITNCTLNEVRFGGYDAVIITGHRTGVTNLCKDMDVGNLLRSHTGAGKLVACTNAGLLVLKAHNILKGSRVTFRRQCEQDLKEYFRYQKDEDVVWDGLLITAGAAGNTFNFALTLVAILTCPQISMIIADDLEIKWDGLLTCCPGLRKTNTP